MATEVTLREEKFDILLHRFDRECTITKIPAPGLVQLVEQGKVSCPETDALLHTILDPYIGKLDALVLGCTHYPFAAEAIGRVLGPEVQLLEGGDGTARETRRRLELAGLLEQGPGEIKIINSSSDPGMIRLSYERLNQGR
jgi:glutamate racemase